MWVVFRKSDKKILGTSPHSSKSELKKDVAIRQVVKGSVEGGNVSDFDAVQVTDDAAALTLLNVGSRQMVVIEEREDGVLQPVIRKPERYFLRLQTDVEESHPIDGIPVLPADGTSAATITVQKLDQEWNVLAGFRDNDELWLRTDHGTIESTRGKAIWHLELERGTATFRLRSDTAARVATVHVLSANPNLGNAAIRIEFRPV